MPSQTDSYVDVLIVGAGPAGFMAATWMSRCGIKTRVVDKRDDKIFRGQADGLQSRTFEILDSFGLGHRAWRESNHMLEMCLWNPDQKGHLRRSNVLADTIPGISRFQHATLNQGRIEQYFLDSFKEHGNIEIERSIMPESLVLDESKAEDAEAYPITVRLKHLTDEKQAPSPSGPTIPNGLFRSNLTADDTDDLLKDQERTAYFETVKAKYLIGCDGAHSWVRRQLGFKLEGEQTDYIWGVLDIIPITDFPDIRKRCAIHSADSGSMMIIPRENNLVRVYCQIKETSQGSTVNRWTITPEEILARAQKILHPYKLTYKHCDWYTAYQIGQRVGSSFSSKDRIFLAGDAVHTHSPKAGQGMNVSMQDTYNLGWKIASVVRGICDRSILSTYQSERRRVALDLIDFDHRFSRLFSGRPARDANDKEGVNMEEFKAAYQNSNLFTCGLAVDYGASMIVAKAGDSKEQGDGTNVSVADFKRRVVGKQHLAKHIRMGMRMPSYQVLNHSDARPWQFQEILKSDGRWRLVIFAGDLTIPDQMERIRELGEQFAAPDSFIRRFTPPTGQVDSVIEILTIHSSPHLAVEFFDFPEILRPFKDDFGWDYGKIYVDDESYHEGHGHAYQNYGVDAHRGCLVVLRPDQHVSFIGELEDVGLVGSFFSGFTNEHKAV